MRLGLVAAILGGLALATVSAQELPEGEPPGAILRQRREPPPPCALELTWRRHQSGQVTRLEAWVRNRGPRGLRFTLADQCPGPPVSVDGLPAGYDAAGTCNRGPCLSHQAEAVMLAPGARRLIGRFEIDVRGNACNSPLPTGHHVLRFSPRFEGPAPALCGPSPIDIAVAAPADPQEPPRPAQRPRPSTSRCPPPIPCGIYCPNGMAHDDKGCGQCACNPSPLEELRPR